MHRIEIGMGMEQPTFKNNLGTLFETLDSHAKKFQIMINYFLLNFLIMLQSRCSLNQCWEVLSFPKEEPMGKGQAYMLSKNIELVFYPLITSQRTG
jgi:hypothetical protein